VSDGEKTGGEAGAAVEIERKYLLSGMPELPASADTIEIQQGYLPNVGAGQDVTGGHVEGRLRRVVHPDGSVEFTHTIKRGEGVKRIEVEQRIASEQFERSWPATEGRRVSKRRHRVRETMGSTTVIWEIDEFTDRDLVLAEVELASEDSQVVLPAWLAGSVVREVTCDPSYTNYELATGGKGERAERGR